MLSDQVLNAKSREEFLIAKDLLGIRRFNQHDSYTILATMSAQRRFQLAFSLVREGKHFKIGQWFCEHDYIERRNRQAYINQCMKEFCWEHEKTMPLY